MDTAALDAIAVHVHVEQDAHGGFSVYQELLDALSVDGPTRSVQDPSGQRMRV
jgi:hypothetical protein